MDIIKIDGLSKTFGEVRAVDNLSLRVREGELFAFLGVNGAGKSTTINIMCGTLGADSGSVVINGKMIDKEANAVKSELGVVFQGSVLDSALSVYDNLESRAALYGIVGDAFKERLSELSELLDFGSFVRRSVGKLSGGQRRRIDIARALIHKPSILILDEPTTGLDPQTRNLLWKVISDLRKNEKLTVLLTTHYMEEAADADYVVIMDGGKISAEGNPPELKSRYSGDFLTLYGIEEESVKSLGLNYETVVGGFKISVPDTAFVTELILKHPELFEDYEVAKGRMDDVFLAVTGKALSGGEDK
jgi:multidrug/hemolysin transport system ATP-binding protein